MIDDLAYKEMEVEGAVDIHFNTMLDCYVVTYHDKPYNYTKFIMLKHKDDVSKKFRDDVYPLLYYKEYWGYNKPFNGFVKEKLYKE